LVSAAAALDLHDNITVKEYVMIFLTTNEIRAALICWPGLYTFFQNSYLVTGWKYGLWIHKPMPRDVVKRAKNHLKKVIGISIVLSISVIKTWQYYSILLCLHVVMLCTTCTILQQIILIHHFRISYFLKKCTNMNCCGMSDRIHASSYQNIVASIYAFSALTLLVR